MFAITEPKIARLEARWAPFPGFSLLFDPPGDAFVERDGVEFLAAEGTNDFYRWVEEGFRALRPDRLMAAYGLCPLPPPSYHVTAYDVANVADLSRCHDRDGLQALLDRLPDAAAFDDDLLAPAREFAQTEWNLAFAYGELKVGNTLVVRLKPVEGEAYARFLEARAGLSRRMGAAYGVGAGERFGPHLSLGYFMNDAGAEQARARTSEWDETLRSHVGETTVAFPTVSLYGFTDMATFFRASSKGQGTGR